MLIYVAVTLQCGTQQFRFQVKICNEYVLLEVETFRQFISMVNSLIVPEVSKII